jgi:hypothetical protein
MVACAPGYPGNTAEAQPTMDALAAAMASAAGWDKTQLAAVYHQSEGPGVARLGEPDAGIAMVPLAFYLEHGDKLQLEPRLGAVMKDAEAAEVWTLVAKRGAITSAASLEGWQIVSLVGFSPGFVRNVALAGWGKLPEGVRITQGSQILSVLRKAAAGEKVAALLDRTQAAALPTLPMARDLEIVTRSAPLPANLVCTVGGRVPEDRWKPLATAMLGLAQSASGAAILNAARISRFLQPDAAGVAAAKKAFTGQPR